MAADPFSGVWKLNLSKSKLPPTVARSQTVRIQADAGGVDVREDIVSATGERLTVAVKAGFDGKDYPVSGTPFADTVAYRRPDSRTITGAARKAGKLVLNETAVVSSDGRTMTSTYTSPDGKPLGVAVFDKQ